MIDINAILDSAVVPHQMRAAVVSLARLLSDVAVREAKAEIVQLCTDHPDLTADQISLAVARSLHSASPLSMHVTSDRNVNSAPCASIGAS